MVPTEQKSSNMATHLAYAMHKKKIIFNLLNTPKQLKTPANEHF